MFLSLLCHFESLIKWFAPCTYIAAITPSFIFYWLLVNILGYKSPYMLKKYDAILYELYLKQIFYLIFSMSRIKIFFYGDFARTLLKCENVILISNHQSNVDWLIVNFIAHKHNQLGNFSIIVKDSFKYIPFLGLYFKLHGFIFIRKDTATNDYDYEAIRRSLKKKIRKPFWINLFPEQTKIENIRKKAPLFALNRKFLIEHDLPQFSYVLMPRIAVTHEILTGLIDQLDAVYDLTIAYTHLNKEHKIPTLLEFLTKPNSFEIHLHLNSISRLELDKLSASYKQSSTSNIILTSRSKSISTSMAAEQQVIIQRDTTAKFLIDMFIKKDKNLANFIYNVSSDFYNENPLMNKKYFYSNRLFSFNEILPGFFLFSLTTLTLFGISFKLLLLKTASTS